MAQRFLSLFVHVALVTAIILGTGCFDTSSLRELASLQSGIAEQFSEPAVSVNLNNRVYLAITFQNSSRADLPAEERAAFARDIGHFVRDHYTGYAALQTISIGFTTHGGAGPVSVSRTEMPYSFTPADLGPAPDSTGAAGGTRTPN